MAEHLTRLYRHRFDDDELAFKAEMWRVLCRHFFQRYVRPDDVVLDLGAGSAEFINAIVCREKIAVDLNPDTKVHAVGARVLALPATDLTPIETGSVDVVFTSNLLEHLPDKAHVSLCLDECRRVLRPGGTLVVLMPNAHYLGGRYWDFFDHHTPLTHLSLSEGVILAGFEVTRVIPRFLPYTVKRHRSLQHSALIRLYLLLRPAWRLFGGQMLVVATSPAANAEAGD